MKSFEDWMHNKSPYGNVSIREAYNAGVKSRQAEVDKLQAEIDELQVMYEKQGLYAFELQKRIDNVEHYLKHSFTKSHEVVLGLLKGNQNEK